MLGDEERTEVDGESTLPVVGELARGSRPFWFWDVEDAFKVLRPVEAAKLSALEMEVSLGGGLAKGHFNNLEGGVTLDEDLAGGEGTPVLNNSEVGEAGMARARAALLVLLRERKHAGIMQFCATLELGQQVRGSNFVDGADLTA